MNETAIIPLSRGFSCVIDAAEFPLVGQLKWYVTFGGGYIPYATRKIRLDNGRRMTTMMHRIIMAAPGNLQVDHINGDSLDNRRANLRLCTASQNQANRRPDIDGRSRFKGVRFAGPNEPSRPWRAAIVVHGEEKYLGRFTSEEEAARAYDTAAKQFFGPFARLNFPNEHQLPPLTEIAKEPVRCLPDYGKNFP